MLKHIPLLVLPTLSQELIVSTCVHDLPRALKEYFKLRESDLHRLLLDSTTSTMIRRGLLAVTSLGQWVPDTESNL